MLEEEDEKIMPEEPRRPLGGAFGKVGCISKGFVYGLNNKDP